ncbi:MULTISPECIES: DUF680 domain-containing protein [unclassified Mesorhizobium]|nr:MULTISPECIES: DUF680 domain-containing protein [unclassified Mesorhizobium]
MSKITFAAVAVLMATGAAFTASIRKPVQSAQPIQEPVRPGSDRHRFGNH